MESGRKMIEHGDRRASSPLKVHGLHVIRTTESGRSIVAIDLETTQAVKE
jgi:hypothetical protein